jgi:hypothetical protein
MNTVGVITSQYLAALEMLKQAVAKCPDQLWDHPDDRTKFWHIAYHALFYVHFYLQDSENAFAVWAKHRPGYQRIDPDARPKIGEPYDRDTVLEYLAFCQQHVAERIPGLDLEAASGFHWLHFDKLELQFYNIRHLQQHIGELMERLGTRAHIDVDWIGMKRAP